jgi:uncharacterized membrane protein
MERPMADPTTPPAPPTAPIPESGQSRGYPPGGRSVEAGRGVAWWTAAWRLFAASPWIFIAMIVVFIVLTVTLALIPVAGSVATTVLAPVFAGGVFAGCRALDRGGELTIGHLFAGFADRLGPLVVVGLLYLAGSFVIVFVFMALLFAVIGASGITVLLMGDPVQAGVAMLATLGMGALFAVLIVALLGIPLLMAYWFAPALVALRNDEPVAAMKTSFSACLANFLPFLVYGLLGLAFAIVASIPLGLGWLVLAPVGVASVYTSYKDIFGD